MRAAGTISLASALVLLAATGSAAEVKAATKKPAPAASAWELKEHKGFQIIVNKTSRASKADGTRLPIAVMGVLCYGRVRVVTFTWLLDLPREGPVVTYTIDQRPPVRVKIGPSDRSATLEDAAASEAFEQLKAGRTVRVEVPSKDHGVLRAQFDVTGFEAAARRFMPLCSP